MLTQQAALDYGADGIRCNAICPGFVFSDMVEEHFGPIARDLGTNLNSFMTKVFQDIPSHKPATPDKIAGICSFLASDDSVYITGTVIPVDGGLAVMDPFPLCVKNADLEMRK
jgi:NAD(P)-dependent dehydrogenase (short-subunit alcohol dehydrogenase family)